MPDTIEETTNDAGIPGFKEKVRGTMKCGVCGLFQTPENIQKCSGAMGKTAGGVQMRPITNGDRKITQRQCPSCLGRKVHKTTGEATKCVQDHDGLQFVAYTTKRLKAALVEDEDEPGHYSEKDGEPLKVHVMSRDGKSYKVTGFDSRSQNRPVTVFIGGRNRSEITVPITDIRFPDHYQLMIERGEVEPKDT